MMKQSVIALIDCDCFYVSCERKDNPKLQDKPVCVMTSVSDKGIVVSRSKEAKNIGVKMGAPYFQIKNIYKDVCYLPSRMKRYGEISDMVMNVIKEFSPDVEIVSVDEAYIDLTGIDKILKLNYEQVIKNIRKTIANKVQIPVSIGLSCSKTLAKLASDVAKNNGGIFIIEPNNILNKVGNINIEQVCGIGHKNTEKLKFNGIFTIKDFVEKDNVLIKQLLGINGLFLKQELLGFTASAVENEVSAPKSVQDTKSFDDFTNNFDFLINALNEHVHNACKKMRQWNGFCSEIEVILRTKDFKQISIGAKFQNPTNSDFEIRKQAQVNLKTLYRSALMYRSVGVVLKNITYNPYMQKSLFDNIKPVDDKLSRIIDDLENKFGQGIVKTGM